MSLKITILGCGNSAGTPAIGNHWGHCDPTEPRNRRSRPSIAVQSEETTLIVDTGPDFREQMNRENIPGLDGVIYTHAHSDHIAGIDDLRVVRMRSKKLVNIYANPETIAEIETRFHYMFTEQTSLYPRVLTAYTIADEQYGKPYTIGDISMIPFEQDHGMCRTLGLRFGDLAYCTDVVSLSDESCATLAGIKTLIVDAAAYKMETNMVHFTLRQVYALNERLRAEKVYLTHLTPGMDYRTLLKEMPAGFEPAYDGLVLTANT